jgi:hypothetical protein
MMIPNTMAIPTRNTVVIQIPIGTPLLPSQIPSLPLGYNVLNASIPIPTQVPSETSGVSNPSGHNLIPSFILTLPQPPSRGSYPSPIGRTDPSGTTKSFTPNYHIHVGGQFHPGGQTQSPFGGQIPIGMPPTVEGKLPPTLPYGQNIPASLAYYWNYLTQNNPQLIGGK